MENLTPQEELLNGQLCKLPVINELQATDQKLLQGQQDIEARLDKGAERMDGLEAELKKLSDAMKDGLKEVITEIKDTKISDLKNELKDRKSSDHSLKNDLIKIGVATVIAVLGYLFVKSYG